MKLSTYLDKNSISVDEFAEIAQISRGTIYNILRGREVMIGMAHMIHKVTKGQVTYEDLITREDLNKGRRIAKKVDSIKEIV